MSEFIDKRLMRQIVDGSESALAALYDRHASLITGRLRMAGASVAEAEDLLQETFLEAWRSADGYRGDGPVAAWLWVIARNKFTSSVRSEVRRRSREAEAAHSHDVVADDEWALALDVRERLASMAPELRTAFEAVAIDGMSVREAAQLMGVPEGTVKSRVYRARVMLKEKAI